MVTFCRPVVYAFLRLITSPRVFGRHAVAVRKGRAVAAAPRAAGRPAHRGRPGARGDCCRARPDARSTQPGTRSRLRHGTIDARPSSASSSRLPPRHRLHREQIIDLLWTDLDPEAGGANLRKAAHDARAAIGAREAVVLRADQVSLEVSVDAKRFESNAEAALRAGDADLCAEAAPLYGGALLPKRRCEGWAEEQRQQLGLYLRLLCRSGSGNAC
jgi:hypothetical protein